MFFWALPMAHCLLVIGIGTGTKMAYINLQNADVEFPIYNASGRSLKSQFLRMATGGGISRRNDGHVVVHGLTNISIEIKSGERIGLIGHNGAGKTTLLRVLSGIYRPTSGTAVIDGKKVSLLNISLGIDPEATGRENIRLRAAMMGIKKDALEKKFEQIADFTDLGDFLDMPLRTYSSGMKMRLAFSISTSINPEILIMDEWLSTGDESFKEKADIKLRSMINSTEILILASHSKHLLSANCNRIIWLEKGAIKMDGTPDEVLNMYFKK